MEKKDGRDAPDNKKRKLNKDDIFLDYKIEGQRIDLLTFLTEEITTLKKGKSNLFDKKTLCYITLF